jgi:hypothetical protein
MLPSYVTVPGGANDRPGMPRFVEWRKPPSQSSSTATFWSQRGCLHLRRPSGDAGSSAAPRSACMAATWMNAFTHLSTNRKPVAYPRPELHCLTLLDSAGIMPATSLWSARQVFLGHPPAEFRLAKVISVRDSCTLPGVLHDGYEIARTENTHGS